MEERTAAVAAFTRAVSNLEFCQTADSLTTTGFNLYISSSNRAVAKTGSCAAIILYNCTNCWGRQCAGNRIRVVNAVTGTKRIRICDLNNFKITNVAIIISMDVDIPNRTA